MAHFHKILEKFSKKPCALPRGWVAPLAPGEKGQRAGKALVEWFDKHLAEEPVVAGGNGK